MTNLPSRRVVLRTYFSKSIVRDKPLWAQYSFMRPYDTLMFLKNCFCWLYFHCGARDPGVRAWTVPITGMHPVHFQQTRVSCSALAHHGSASEDTSSYRTDMVQNERNNCSQTSRFVRNFMRFCSFSWFLHYLFLLFRLSPSSDFRDSGHPRGGRRQNVFSPAYALREWFVLWFSQFSFCGQPKVKNPFFHKHFLWCQVVRFLSVLPLSTWKFLLGGLFRFFMKNMKFDDRTWRYEGTGVFLRKMNGSEKMQKLSWQ